MDMLMNEFMNRQQNKLNSSNTIFGDQPKNKQINYMGIGDRAVSSSLFGQEANV